MSQLLEIENELEKREKGLFQKYIVLKNELLANEYIFTLSGFVGGNDHGPNHIKRVLEYLNSLVQGNPLDSLSPLELYLLLCSAVIHDIGMIQGREDHHIASRNLIFSKGYDLVSDDEHIKGILSRIVSSHSSKTKIDDEFKSRDRKEAIGSHFVRPKYLAALLRLADEMDEDYRRAHNRIFQNGYIPDESLIYWLINRRIQSLSIVKDEQLIKVLVNYKNSDIKNLYPYGELQVNVIAAIYHKMTKLYNELQYCMKFMEDGLSIRDVEIVFRDLKDKKISVKLNGDVSSMPDDLQSIYKEQKLKKNGPKKSHKDESEPKETSKSSNWLTLSDTIKEKIIKNNSDFVNDAIAIIDRPDLFGKWNLIITNAKNEHLISLEFSIYDTNNFPQKIDVTIFPIGKYPISKPEFEIRQSRTSQLRGWQALSQKLSKLLSEASWRDKYLKLNQNRLFYIAEDIKQNQNPLELFIFQAEAFCKRASFEGWEIIKPQNDLPYVQKKLLADKNNSFVKIIPTTKYPLRPPKVICHPIPKSDLWLGNGEMNWERGLQGKKLMEYWTELLYQDSYIENFVNQIEEIIQ